MEAVRDYDAAKKTPDYQHSAGPCLGSLGICVLVGGGRTEFHHPVHDHLYRQVLRGPNTGISCPYLTRGCEPRISNTRPRSYLWRSSTSIHNHRSHPVGQFCYLAFRAAIVLCSSASMTLGTENRTVPRESLMKGILPSFCHARIVRTETLNSDASESAVMSCGCSLVSFMFNGASQSLDRRAQILCFGSSVSRFQCDHLRRLLPLPDQNFVVLLTAEPEGSKEAFEPFIHARNSEKRVESCFSKSRMQKPNEVTQVLRALF